MAADPRTVATQHARRPATPAGRPRPQAPPRPPQPLWRRLYKDWGGYAGLVLTAILIVIGITGRDSRRLFADEGLGYALGIIGSLLILVLLVYPLRKRYKFLKFIGKVPDWFRTHMILGVVGPLTILYHSNFSFGSVNSSAALIAMLLVAGSGIVGRFLYAKVHKGLYGRKTSLKELLANVKVSTAQTGGAAQFVPNLLQEIAEFDRQVLKPPKGVIDAVILPFRLMIKTRLGYRRIINFVDEQLDEQAVVSPAVAAHRERLLQLTSAFVAEHLRRVRRVATFAAYDQLFALWHKIHLPFFYLLIVTAIIHVIAVHTYAM